MLFVSCGLYEYDARREDCALQEGWSFETDRTARSPRLLYQLFGQLDWMVVNGPRGYVYTHIVAHNFIYKGITCLIVVDASSHSIIQIDT